MFRVSVKKYTSRASHTPLGVNYCSFMNRRSSPSENLAANLKKLMAESGINSNRHLARLSGVSDRMIGRILSCDSIATVDMAEKLGKPFGLTGWEMIMPNLLVGLVKDGRLEKLMENYSLSSNEGRAVIDQIAEREAVYQKTSNQ